MRERLIVKSFGPVKELDITFRKVTVFIGDQGTGKVVLQNSFLFSNGWRKSCCYNVKNKLLRTV